MPVVSERLAAAGFMLPGPPTPAGDYVPAVRTDGLVFTAGQLPLIDGALHASGLVGEGVAPDLATECARIAVLNALAAAATVCDLDEVARAVKLVGYVACVPEFISQPAVINGASAVLAAAFGANGAHAREAIGVASLPMGAPVEVSLVLSLR